jgi:hypothetical protein
MDAEHERTDMDELTGEECHRATAVELVERRERHIGAAGAAGG